jgi:hypothetical protein
MKHSLLKGFLAVICVILTVAVLYASDSAEKGKNVPVARYWMSVATQKMSIPGMPEDMPGMGGMFGKLGGATRSLQLQVNSSKPAPAEPAATHDIPPGQNMGDTLPLLTPPPVKERRGEPVEREMPEHFEKPKARMLMYWGCDEKVREGQPRVIDTEKMGPLEFGKALSGRSGSQQYLPSPRSGQVYAEWPNDRKRVDVPKDASLKGDHLVHGNYLPDIRFTLGEQQDFMAPVEFTSVTGKRAGSLRFQWRAIPTSIGYFVMAIAHSEKTGETIIWSSSEVAEPGYGLMDYLPGSDVRHFIKEKVVMPPQTTSCSIPAGIFKDAEGASLQFIAYGEDLSIVYPPKPKDPVKPWNPVWSAHVRLKSTGMLPLVDTEQEKHGRPKTKGRDYSSRETGREYTAQKAGRDYSSGTGAETQEKGKLGAPLKILKGLFGF